MLLFFPFIPLQVQFRSEGGLPILMMLGSKNPMSNPIHLLLLGGTNRMEGDGGAMEQVSLERNPRMLTTSIITLRNAPSATEWMLWGTFISLALVCTE